MAKKQPDDGVVRVDGAQFQLVIINYEGDGYYYTTSVQLGKVQKPLKPEMLKMVEQHQFVEHNPDPPTVDASSLVEHDIAAAPKDEGDDFQTQFFGTYYLNLNAFKYGPPPQPDPKKG